MLIFNDQLSYQIGRIYRLEILALLGALEVENLESSTVFVTFLGALPKRKTSESSEIYVMAKPHPHKFFILS